MKDIKIGMYGGKFMPLHKGHLYCIDTASKTCDLVYAILFANGNEEEEILANDKSEYLTLENRWKCLQEVCKVYSNVEPVLIDVKDCRLLDGSEDWDAETPLVREVIPEGDMDYVFSSEISYDDYFQRAYPEAKHILVDPTREKYPISGTLVRAMKTLEEQQKWMVGLQD